ncbi:MAG: hypothetical protein DRG63_00910 [Deltaproteobacteria bacterium]|nr:MAG: hypothetical protein DRG63_00910 [Deltaproteobacteria bacterium]
MKSKIAEAIRTRYEPVGIIWTDEKPAEAKGFKKGKWGCVMWMLAAAAKGKIAAFSKETYGCWGGGVGLGFGNQYLAFPGGIECFYSFLSSGNEQTPKGKEIAKGIEKFVTKDFLEDFLHGVGYLKSPELVKNFVENMPMMDVPSRYVVFKSLKAIDPSQEQPQVIVFLVNPDQLSALVILANYGREGTENVTIPYAAGCQTIGVFAYKEAQSEYPRAVVGLTDISARLNIRKQLGKNLLSFAVPWKMFLEMEKNVGGSFLQRPTWQSLLRGIND